MSLKTLRDSSITHIINCATGIPNFFPDHFVYLKIDIFDLPESDIRLHFDKCHNFMRECVLKGGNVCFFLNFPLSLFRSNFISFKL